MIELGSNGSVIIKNIYKYRSVSLEEVHLLQSGEFLIGLVLRIILYRS